MSAPAPALWRLGFRPLFLLASVAAVVLPSLWVGIYAAGWPAPAYFPPIVWHGHEMLYGFVAAVVSGFVLTASQSWAGKPGVSGRRLQVLAAAWLVARLLPFWVTSPSVVYALTDLAFLGGTAFLLSRYIPEQKPQRTLVVLGIVLAFLSGNVLVHLGPFLDDAALSLRGLRIGLGTIVLLVLVIGGRIIPTFSRNKFPQATIRNIPWLDRLALLTAAAYVVSDVAGTATEPWTKILAAVAAAANLARWLAWGPWVVRSDPMLVILQAGYAWMIAGFALRPLSAVLPLAPGVMTHAFAAGGIGVIIYAMIPRVSLGHTGRPIVASRWLVAGFHCVNAAALVRVAAGALFPSHYTETVVIAGTLWVVAFLLLVILLARVWLTPRVDGKTG